MMVPENPHSSPAPVLSQADVARLLTDDSPASRADILEKVAACYNGNQFATREREVAEQIFRLLMRDVALRVRETLAERIKANQAIPRDIVLHLANDVHTVATPVLEASSVLSDADLVRIIEASRDMAKLVAITKRGTVSPRVSDALVETTYSEVVTSLLSNQGAKLTDRALAKIMDDFKGDMQVTELLVHQRQLPITIVERLVNQVSDAMAAELTEKYKLSDHHIRQDATNVREDFMLRLLHGDLPLAEIETLVAQMDSEQRLTPSLVMTALCRGQLAFFTIALARLARVSVASATRLVSDRGAHGFVAIYEKSGLPPSMFEAIRLLLRAVQDLQGDRSIPGSMLYANRLVERVVNSAGDRPIEYLPYFIALIRQNVHRM